MPGIDAESPEVRQFWAWFVTIAPRLETDFEHPILLAELDERVSMLGDVGWEIGPGRTCENALTISPDGDPEMLRVTKAIVSASPRVPAWEFHAARQPRTPNLTFTLDAPAGLPRVIDASGWRYALLRYPDGMVEILLEQQNLADLREEDRYTAAVLFIDGTVGEETRLRCICEVTPVVRLPLPQADKANDVAVLAEHLCSMFPET